MMPILYLILGALHGLGVSLQLEVPQDHFIQFVLHRCHLTLQCLNNSPILLQFQVYGVDFIPSNSDVVLILSLNDV
jgi:hypothetical protein